MLILLVKFGWGAHITSVLGMGAKITSEMRTPSC
jgi:hypothetical protein